MVRTFAHNKKFEDLMDGVVGHKHLHVYDSVDKWQTISDTDGLSKGQNVVCAAQHPPHAPTPVTC